MKAKFTLPYMLGGMMTLGMFLNSSNTSAKSYDSHDNDSTKHSIDSTYLLPQDTAAIEIDFSKLMPHAVEALEYKKEVLYVMSTGDTVRRCGGTRAWRNNNPGCLVYGKYTREKGAIGKGGKFAVFPDYETGRNALADLLRSDKYRNLSIERAITKYAPPYENDVATYKKRLSKLTGLTLNKKLCDLDSAGVNKVADAICTIEGWREGKIEYSTANNMLASTKTKLMHDSIQNTL